MSRIYEWLRTSAAKGLVVAIFVFLVVSMGSQAVWADDASAWLNSTFSNASSSGKSRLGGPDTERRASSRISGDSSSRGRNSKGVQVASLGGGGYERSPSLGKSLSGGGGIKWAASSSCLSGSLASKIASVAAQYGSVTVTSTCRSHSQNARAGGAPKSYHLSGEAADFRVHGNWGAAMSYLQSSHGGGFKHYGGGLFHIDTGPRRPM